MAGTVGVYIGPHDHARIVNADRSGALGCGRSGTRRIEAGKVPVRRANEAVRHSSGVRVSARSLSSTESKPNKTADTICDRVLTETLRPTLP